MKNGPKELLSLLGSDSGSDDIRKQIEERNFNLFRMIMVTSACFVIFITPMMVQSNLALRNCFDKEQIGIKEPFPVTNLPFTS